jgi:hypothetical protein
MKNLSLPQGITIEMLKENYDTALSQYAPAFKRALILDATDKGRLWKALSVKFPQYQILPDTNHVSYVKNNLLASLYSVGKCADILPTSAEDKDTITRVNVMMDYIWDILDVPYYQMLAGERAALMNMGVTQVGWDTSIMQGSGANFKKGLPVLKNIDPLKYMRDPFAENLDTASYAITWDEYHKSVIKADPNYKETFREQLYSSPTADPTFKLTDKTGSKDKDYYKIFFHFIRVDNMVHEIHTLNNDYVLYVKENIQPAMLPFAELFCNVPNGDLIGTSEPSKIFANSVAYNIMNSVMLTADYKNQRPPRYVNAQSQLDLRSFIKNGNDSDYTFLVQGDASRAVHYHQFPQVSQVTQQVMRQLGMDIQQVTGVDGAYTGKDTGSILTTGGIDSMLDQATLIDQPKIVNYERYTRRLSQLITTNFIKYGGKRTYYVKTGTKQQMKAIEVNYSDIPNNILLHYALNISTYLPKTKQRVAQMASVLMEKQMQYQQMGAKVQLITPEEWLMLQDIPMKEFMLERMGVQREHDFIDQVSQTIFQYTDLIEQGMDPEDAIMATADSLSAVQNPQQPVMG